MVSCGIYEKNKKYMCCNICFEINYVPVACHVLIDVSFMIISESNAMWDV